MDPGFMGRGSRDLGYMGRIRGRIWDSEVGSGEGSGIYGQDRGKDHGGGHVRDPG